MVTAYLLFVSVLELVVLGAAIADSDSSAGLVVARLVHLGVIAAVFTKHLGVW